MLSFIHLNDRNSCVKNEERAREKFIPWLLSHLRTAGQSLSEVSVNVRLSVSEFQWPQNNSLNVHMGM